MLALPVSFLWTKLQSTSV